MGKQLDITILTDNPGSWMMSYVPDLIDRLHRRDHNVIWAYNWDEVPGGDILVMLSCERILSRRQLARHKSNVVVHPSNLPFGRGWSPLAWQVLEEKTSIPICLFEAVTKVDTGPVYLRDVIRTEGNELNEELKQKQGEKTVEMVIKYVDNYPMKGEQQEGSGTYYPRRTPADSELEMDRTLGELFNQLRVVDNDRYPAWFQYRGKTYVLKIYEKSI